MNHAEAALGILLKRALSLNADWRAVANNSSNLVHSYLETLFTRPIHSSFSDQYKLTAAVAQHLTSSFNEDAKHDVRSDRTIALRYPSVVDIEHSYNTVMHRDFAHERLQLLHVLELTVDEVRDNEVRCTVTDNAYDINATLIVWSGDPGAFPAARPGGDTPLVYTGSRWRLVLATDPGEGWTYDEMIDENFALRPDLPS